MFKKLQEVEHRFNEVERRLQDSSLSPEELRQLSKEHADLQEIVHCFRDLKKMEEDVLFAKTLLKESDEEMRQAAKEEVSVLEPKIAKARKNLNTLLLPKDPNDEKNIILEIRAGAGGSEAALFVADVFRMYQKYAEHKNWRVETMSVSGIGIGGIKEISASIKGARVYSKLKNEAGVHRVQRVPDTESQGRVHTSTITVAILPEAEEVDVQINPADLRIDVFRASGSGGQHVNTTDSAVRITHLPTGVVVSMQDEKSQHKNKDKAMKILRARILEAEIAKSHAEQSANRKAMVGTGDRSERIRTYNFPQSRLTDHRIGLNLHSLTDIMNGDLDPLIDALIAHTQAEQMKNKDNL